MHGPLPQSVPCAATLAQLTIRSEINGYSADTKMVKVRTKTMRSNLEKRVIAPGAVFFLMRSRSRQQQHARYMMRACLAAHVCSSSKFQLVLAGQPPLVDELIIAAGVSLVHSLQGLFGFCRN
jgi:hypothetical protein